MFDYEYYKCIENIEYDCIEDDCIEEELECKVQHIKCKMNYYKSFFKFNKPYSYYRYAECCSDIIPYLMDLKRYSEASAYSQKRRECYETAEYLRKTIERISEKEYQKVVSLDENYLQLRPSTKEEYIETLEYCEKAIKYCKKAIKINAYNKKYLLKSRELENKQIYLQNNIKML